MLIQYASIFLFILAHFHLVCVYELHYVLYFLKRKACLKNVV